MSWCVFIGVTNKVKRPALLADDGDEIVTAGPDISPTVLPTKNLEVNSSFSPGKLGESLRDLGGELASTVHRREGDGGPAFEPPASDKSGSDSDSQHDAREETADSSSHLGGNLLDGSFDARHPGLTPTTALYEELNQSKTPELPSLRHRSLVSTSRDDALALTLSSTSAKDTHTPSRSPKLEELHRSLDHFEEIAHSIQEAAKNVSTASQESVFGSVNRMASDKVIDPESERADTPHCGDDDIEGIANTSARVIEVRDGTFSEFMEMLPDEAPRVTEDRLSSTFSLPVRFSETRDSPQHQADILSQTLPSIVSLDQKLLGHLDKETESIIERYKRLKLGSTRSLQPLGNEVSEDEKTKSPEKKKVPKKSIVSEKNLRGAPNKSKLGMSPHSSLDNELNTETSLISLEKFKKPKTPPRTGRANGKKDAVCLSPFSTPKKQTREDGE